MSGFDIDTRIGKKRRASSYGTDKRARRGSYVKSYGSTGAAAPVTVSVKTTRPMSKKGLRYTMRTGGLGFGGPELHFFDTVYDGEQEGEEGGSKIPNGWSGPTCLQEYTTGGLFVPKQGSGTSDREGMKTIVKTIEVNGWIYRKPRLSLFTAMGEPYADDHANKDILVQLSLVMDTQSNGATLAPGDVFLNGNGTTTEPDVPGLRSIETSSRYKVLRTTYAMLHDTVTTSMIEQEGGTMAYLCTSSGCSVQFKWRLKMHQPVGFTGTGGTGGIADCKDVTFHILGAAAGSATDTEERVGTIYCKYNSRIRFIC